MFSDEENQLVLSEPYVEYLSVYNNNVISQSKPVQIDLSVTESNFQVLYQKYIEKNVILPEKEKHSVNKVKEIFIPRVKKYFSIDKELTTNDFPTLLFPVTCDLLGKNERTVISQFLDLERAIYHIKNDYYDIEHIPNAICDGQLFLVSPEPDKKALPSQHSIWKQVRVNKDYDYVDISEIDKIEEYAKEHGVIPYTTN